jgi:hypothetical protein
LTLGDSAVYNMDSKQVTVINRNCAPSKGRMIEQVGILHGKGQPPTVSESCAVCSNVHSKA